MISTTNSNVVSVVVITYNAANFVLETLHSILNQTYEQIELIITDDCSKDATVAICKEWLEINKGRFERTELIQSEKNVGVSANCNKGFTSAQGDWIKLIAGDDILDVECIQNNMNYIIEYSDVQVLFSTQMAFNSVFKVENYSRILNRSNEFIHRKGITARQQFLSLLFKYGINSPTLFIQKKLFETIGGYDERMTRIEDVVLYYRILKQGVKLHYLDQCTVFYREHPASISKSKDAATERIKFQERKLRDEIYILNDIHGITKLLFKLHTRLIFAKSSFSQKVRKGISTTGLFLIRKKLIQ